MNEQHGFSHGKRFLARLLVFLIFALPAVSLADGENLLENGSFEMVDEYGMPVGWYPDAYVLDDGYTVYAIQEDAQAPDGNLVAFIHNIGDNDARFAQTVEVEPESLYCFSGWIRGEGIEEGRGANLSIEGIYVFSESVWDTDGEWTRIEWYGESGEEQDWITVFARLGGYSGESRGQAWFDGLELRKVDRVPGDGTASLWFRPNDPGDAIEEEEEEGETASPAWPRLILLALLYTVIALLLLNRGEESPLRSAGKEKKGLLVSGLALALALRLVLAWWINGYQVDVNCFTSWGRTMASEGAASFYASTSFCDYPPAYVWILGLNSLISSWLGGSAPVTRVVFRFIPCLADVVACWMIRRVIRVRAPQVSSGKADAFCLLLAFNPALIVNSAAWGQMDSVLCLCFLAVAFWAMEDRWELALPMYMLSVLVKPQALMLGFLGLGAAGQAWIRNPGCRRKMLIGLAGALGVAAVIILPFGIGQQPGWLIERYTSTLSSYPYATLNTANLYYLFHGNWSKLESTADWRVPAILAALCLAYGIRWTMRNRGYRKHLWMEQGLIGLFVAWFIYCAVIGAGWNMVGTAAMACAFLVVLSLFLRRGDISLLPYFGALLFILLYVFGIKMHERYIYPALFLLGLAWTIRPDRRTLSLLLSLSVPVFLNVGVVLDNSIRLGSSLGHLNADNVTLANILSVIHVLAAVYAVHLGIEFTAEKAKEPARLPLFRDSAVDNRLHWKKKDSLILCAILIAYSAICFPTLGSTKAPQSAWSSTDYEETVTFDLGESRSDFTVMYFARVSRYDFSFAFSEDGVHWSEEAWAQMNQGSCWKWMYVTESTVSGDGTVTFPSYGARRTFNARYVRLTAHQIGLTLCEVLFRDMDGRVLPVSVLSRENANEDSSLYSDPACLVDEQDTLEGLPVYFAIPEDEQEGETNPANPQPSWWNSTYFDEIYHARTAYEFLNASVPYETSHPPLGKILMSWGVAIFGMTPFGWRFSGAVAGVLMLFGMYLLGKQLTKSTGVGAMMCALMALDCMHFTQTQIATIDSYPTLFILFAYFFMLRFLQTDPGKERLSRILWDLGCCGLFMGLAIASKWIGIYAGAGLGVLFFTHLIRWMVLTRKQPAADAPSPWRRALVICLWCVLFFIAVPVTIYLVSYIPYFAYRHITSFSEYLNCVWSSQIGMLRYHSTPGLGMDHAFYSPWYEWPVIGKPMFYSTKQYIFSEHFSFSIFCFGNPMIWLTAIGTMVICAAQWAWRRISLGDRTRAEEMTFAAPLGTFSGVDIQLLFVLIGFLAQYLPWTLVPRGTYIYHYFASVPFLIASIAMVLHQVRLWHPRTGK